MTLITSLKGIGEKTAKLYEKLGITTVEDAVFYFPRDYVTYSPICPAEKIIPETVLAVEAVVVKRPLMKRVRKLSITSVTLSADGAHITATFFNMPYLTKSLLAGRSYVFYGKVTSESDHYHMEQPRIFSKEDYEELLGHINPVYSLTKGLTNNAITKTIKNSFEISRSFEPEVYDMHFPKDVETLLRARKKLVYEEFLVFMLRLRLLGDKDSYPRNDFRILEAAESNRIIEKLPYRLTDAQNRVWKEVSEDLCQSRSMRRLVQGDVGCGKTVIAMLAAVQTAVNGYQCAIMAPTEILADQHYESIKMTLKTSGIDIPVIMLTGSMTASAKKNVREKIVNTKGAIIIGTHALFQEKVEYNDLALVITDEQHRFGVEQREILAGKNKDVTPHVLVMSATPIPRTLAMILYGDLSISIIDEVPSHKKPIKNAVVGEEYRKKAYEFMAKEISEGHQVYVICPLIEESEGLDAKNVNDTAKLMESFFDDDVKIGVLHGRMKNSQKQKIMDDFAGNYINILVSTTVVEVGINVPNATVMMIEDADRFGLAALHQLRGRIGRGDAQSYCIFMSSKDDPAENKRLNILKESNDGFKIAEEDLKLRGPGDIFGKRQSGDLRFRLGDIYSDIDLLKKASDDAAAILESDPDLSDKSHQNLYNTIHCGGDLKNHYIML